MLKEEHCSNNMIQKNFSIYNIFEKVSYPDLLQVGCHEEIKNKTENETGNVFKPKFLKKTRITSRINYYSTNN